MLLTGGQNKKTLPLKKVKKCQEKSH